MRHFAVIAHAQAPVSSAADWTARVLIGVDLGGHGYAKVQLSVAEMRTEFVCIPRPIASSERPDGGPIRYRVLHTAALWKSGERPQLKTSVLEGDVGLAI